MMPAQTSTGAILSGNQARRIRRGHSLDTGDKARTSIADELLRGSVAMWTSRIRAVGFDNPTR